MPGLIRIQPQEQIPGQIPYGHADPAAFALPATALYQGAMHLEETSLQGLRAFETAQKQAADLGDQVQRGTVLAQLEEQVSSGLHALRSKGLEPEAYQAQAQQFLQRQIQEAQRQIRDPLGQQKFTLEAARFGAKARTELNTEVFKLKLGRTAMEVGDSLTRLANDVVFQTDPELRAAAYEHGLRLPTQMFNAGVWTKDEAVAASRTFLGTIEKGSIERDAQNPQLIDSVIKLLSTGGYQHIPPDQQGHLLDAVISKRNTLRKQADQERKEQGEEKERQLVWAIRDANDLPTLNQIETNLRALSEPGERWFSSEKIEHFQKMIDAKKDPKATDNPVTVRTLQPRVFALKTTESAIAALEQETNQALEDGNLTGPRHSQYLNELQQQRERLRSGPVDKLLHQEHTDVEASIKSLLRTKMPMSQDFDMRQQAVTEDALMEFQKASKAQGGPENPREWWDRRRPYFIARMLGMQTQYTDGVISGIPMAYRPVGPLNFDKPEEASARIAEAFAKLRIDMRSGVFKTASEWRNAGEKLAELDNLVVEYTRLLKEQKPAPAGPAPRPSGAVGGRH